MAWPCQDTRGKRPGCYLDQAPRFDALGGDQAGLDVGILPGEVSDLLRIDAAKDQCGAVRGVTEGASHDDAPRFALGPYALEVGLAVRGAPLGNALHVVVEKDVVLARIDHGGRTLRYAGGMADIQKRGSYTPRRAREQRAYRVVVTGGVAGVIGVVGLVLAVAGVIGAGVPIVALIVAAICLVLFRSMVGK